MTAKQLIAALLNLHTDYQDSDIAILFVDKDGKTDMQLLASAGIAMTDEDSIPVLATTEATILKAKENRVKMINTGLPPTDEDLKERPDETQ